MQHDKDMKRDASIGHTLCADIPDLPISSKCKRIAKKKGETFWLGTFSRWIGHEANEYCKDGLCSAGTCKGFLRDDVHVKLLKENSEYTL